MIAIIIKDIMALKKSWLSMIIIVIFFAFQGMFKKDLYFVSIICTLFPATMMLTSFAYDAKSKFEQFAFSTPLKRSTYIMGKLFYGLVFGIIGAMFMLKYVIGIQAPPENMITFPILTILFSLLVPSIFLPFIVKFGIEKTRIIIACVYASFIGILQFRDRFNFDGIIASLESMPSYVISFGLIAFCIVLIFVLVKISIIIISNKEF